MEVPFYYILKVNLIRFEKNGKIDFINEEREFINENPLIAREEALNSYGSYIDTLIGENIPHSKAKKLLSNRIVKRKADYNEKVEVNDMFSGIGVFLKINKPINNDEKGDEYLIHGIGFSFDDEQTLMDNLNFEKEYYDFYKYDIKDYLIEMEFYEADEDDTNIEVILKTPNDWLHNKKNLLLFYSNDENFHNTDDNEQDDEIEQNDYINDVFKRLIKTGETKTIEFKSSLFSYKNDYGEIGYSRHIKFKIAKTIASFLNSNGGFLLVGVSDDKSIIGLDADFSLASKNGKDDKKDYIRLEVDRIIKEYFKPYLPLIFGNFYEIDDKLIYYFAIKPSKKPVFIMNSTNKDKELHKKEFYVRLTGASSVLYEDTEEIVNYCLNHWCDK